MFERDLPDEAATWALAGELLPHLNAGDVVLLEGELGAGKTTFARGLLTALGWRGDVRSPSFGLVLTYTTTPPVLHADLYRVASADGLGLEDDFPTHLSLIEWPDRLHGLLDPNDCWLIHLAFVGDGRRATVTPPRKFGAR